MLKKGHCLEVCQNFKEGFSILVKSLKMQISVSCFVFLLAAIISSLHDFIINFTFMINVYMIVPIHSVKYVLIRKEIYRKNSKIWDTSNNCHNCPKNRKV